MYTYIHIGKQPHIGSDVMDSQRPIPYLPSPWPSIPLLPPAIKWLGEDALLSKFTKGLTYHTQSLAVVNR